VTDIRGDNFVFKNKTGFTPFYYRKAWQDVVAAAKLEDFRFHDLRHLAASHLAMAGASQRELMEVLGHKSAQMTKRYSHFFDQHVADLGDRLTERLFGAEK
jgi:integrase